MWTLFLVKTNWNSKLEALLLEGICKEKYKYVCQFPPGSSSSSYYVVF